MSWLLEPEKPLPWTAFRQTGKTVLTYNIHMLITVKNFLRIRYSAMTRLMFGTPLWDIYHKLMNIRLGFLLKKVWWD